MRTIQYQLTRKLMLALAVLFVFASVGIYFAMREALLEQFDQALRAKANTVSSAAEQHGDGVEVELTEQSMHEFDEGVPVEFFQVWSAAGTTVKRSESLGTTNLVQFTSFQHPRYWNLVLPTGARGRAVGYNFSPDAPDSSESSPVKGAANATASVVFASDREDLDESLHLLAMVLGGFVFLSMLATVAIVPRVLRRELSPLNQLSEQVTRIDAKSLSYRFVVETVPGEIKPITERLNHLMSRLENSFERERRFSADLAHELRTPIAELRNLAEVALNWPESRPGATDKDTLDIAVQMEGIVTRLLDLLRSETGQVALKAEPVLLAGLMERVWQPYRGKAQAKGLTVVENVPGDATIYSDPVLLRSILTNLIDNAVEYTPAGGSIKIDAGVVGAAFRLRIGNTVENLTPEDVSKLFDRFWRKDKARSDAWRSGLGLSLSRALGGVLGMELTAAMGGPTCLVLTLQGHTQKASGC